MGWILMNNNTNENFNWVGGTVLFIALLSLGYHAPVLAIILAIAYFMSVWNRG